MICVLKKIVVAGVILKDDKILILQRSIDENIFPGLWELPSGKKEFFESNQKALLREIKEETNLDVKNIKKISSFDYTIKKENNIFNRKQINYLVEPLNYNVVLSREHQNFLWITKSEIDDYNITEQIKNVMKNIFS